jgi:hypothetical protein
MKDYAARLLNKKMYLPGRHMQRPGKAVYIIVKKRSAKQMHYTVQVGAASKQKTPVHVDVLLKWLKSTKHEPEQDEKGNMPKDAIKIEVIKIVTEFDDNGVVLKVRKKSKNGKTVVASNKKQYRMKYVIDNMLS